jgi:hypothetical protein
MTEATTAGSAIEAWGRFLASTLETTRRMIAERPANGPDDEALIVRNAARLMRQALDWEVEATDTANPRLASWEVPALTGCPPGPNIDSPYSLCRLDPRSTYVLEGSTDGLFDVVVQIRPDFPPKSWEILGDLNFAHIKPENGHWRVTMGPKPVDGGAFIQFPDNPGDLHLFLRIYWIDWNHGPRPDVSIRRIAGPASVTARATGPSLAAQLDAAGRYLDMRAAFQHNWFVNFFDTTTEPSNVPGSSETFRYFGKRYELASDEALIIAFDVPKARYWSVQLYDGLVYDCMEFFRSITLRNLLQSHVDPDGRVRMVIAHRDPGVQNWLDADGVPEASWMYRAIWSEDNPEVTATKCKLAELPGNLHPETPAYSAEQRAEEMAVRQRKLSHHFFW